MNDRKKISIALATYNGERYLEEQLNSFLSQTILPDEIVISDDNSTDSTLTILKNFKKKAPFSVELLINNGKGFNNNFENALKNTNGDLVFISDQDDMWLDHKIESIYSFFQKNSKYQLLIHDLEYCDSQMKPIGQTKIERIKLYDPSLKGYVTGMATVVRSNFLSSCLPLSKNTNYDSWIHNCASVAGLRIVKDDMLALYRRHENNATKGSFVNRNVKTGSLDVLFNKMKNIPSHKIKKTRNTLNDLLEYLNSNKNLLVRTFLVDNFEEKIRSLENEIQFLNERIEILNKARIFRFPRLLNLWFTNGYDQYSGYKSMLKDLFYK
ncbi:MAG: glycosyltransferase [Candidatus Paceibacterota bacterium]